jgi:hypothetical protein
VLKGDESTFQQQKHNPNKITKPTEEEWDQLDLWLASYDQNNYQTLPLKLSGLGPDMSDLGWIYAEKGDICPVHLKIFFSTLILELGGTKLDET